MLDIFISIVVGAGTGWWVARIFYRKSHLDNAIWMIKFCCPTRRESKREHDGLSDTAHSMRILSEIVARSFSKESMVIRHIAEEMDSLPELQEPPPKEEELKRAALKRKWEKDITDLYGIY